MKNGAVWFIVGMICTMGLPVAVYAGEGVVGVKHEGVGIIPATNGNPAEQDKETMEEMAPVDQALNGQKTVSASDATTKEKVNENQKVNEKQKDKVDEKRSLEELRKDLEDLTRKQLEIVEKDIREYEVLLDKNGVREHERLKYAQDLKEKYSLEAEIREYQGKRLNREEALKKQKEMWEKIKKALTIRKPARETEKQRLEAEKKLKIIDSELKKIQEEKESKSNKPPK